MMMPGPFFVVAEFLLHGYRQLWEKPEGILENSSWPMVTPKERNPEDCQGYEEKDAKEKKQRQTKRKREKIYKEDGMTGKKIAEKRVE